MESHPLFVNVKKDPQENSLAFDSPNKKTTFVRKTVRRVFQSASH